MSESHLLPCCACRAGSPTTRSSPRWPRGKPPVARVLRHTRRLPHLQLVVDYLYSGRVVQDLPSFCTTAPAGSSPDARERESAVRLSPSFRAPGGGQAPWTDPLASLVDTAFISHIGLLASPPCFLPQLLMLSFFLLRARTDPNGLDPACTYSRCIDPACTVCVVQQWSRSSHILEGKED